METNKSIAKSTHNELAMALSSPKVLDSAPVEVATVVMQAIQYGCLFSGQMKPINETDLTITTKFSTDYIVSSCPTIRLSEIQIAIRDGLLGDFGDYYGINAATIIKFIKAHVKREKRVLLLSEMNIKEKLQPEELTPEQLESIAQKAYLDCLENFKTTGVIEDAGNAIYDWLVRTKKMSPTVKEKNEALNEVKKVEIERLLKEQASEAKKGNRQDVKRIKDQVERITQNNASVISLAKKKLLSDHFKNLLSNEGNLL